MPVQAPHTPRRQRIAVIGGGWAGMAAAVGLVQQGHTVHVWEMARQWGGRARSLAIATPDGQTHTLDNGQHILIGAYRECLRLMRTVGVDPDNALLRLPLDLRYADGQGLQLPVWPAPWDAVGGICTAQGWTWREKLLLLRQAARWKAQGFQCPAHASVQEVCRGLPATLMQDFIDPLCISALNLPASQASGAVFLRVLKDALFAGTGGSNLLIPRVDLGTLFPASAAVWLEQQGAHLHLGERVQQLLPQPDAACAQEGWTVNGAPFDAVIVASSATEAARLVGQASKSLVGNQATACAQWAQSTDNVPHTAIATVYICQTDPYPRLPAPMVALRSATKAPAQFAFDRGQIDGKSEVMALVISAQDALPFSDRETLEQLVLQQAREQLNLHSAQVLRTVIEKRATFACTPLVKRPPPIIAPGLWACGDYVDGPYPATLEGAVLSGTFVAQAIGG